MKKDQTENNKKTSKIKEFLKDIPEKRDDKNSDTKQQEKPQKKTHNKKNNREIEEKMNIENLVAVKILQNRCFYIVENTHGISSGDHVVIKTTRGKELAVAVPLHHKCSCELKRGFVCGIVRKATDEDLKTAESNKKKEKDAFKKCSELIVKHKLDMELIKVYYLLDGAKIIFYFKSAGKVDFRELVKDLAFVFKTRIELRQIGVRDETKLIGGIGSCGRETCCSSWMNEFSSVSIKMVKDQNLSMNSTKVSGLCGRLMCCLCYEHDYYAQERKNFPKQGKNATVDDVKYKVLQVDVIQKRMCIQNPEKKITWLQGKELEEFLSVWSKEKQKRIEQENVRKQKKKDKKKEKDKENPKNASNEK